MRQKGHLRRESRRTVDDEIIKSGLLCLLCELVHAALAQSGQSDRRGQQVQRLVHRMTRHGVRELHHAARHVGKRVDHPVRHAQYDIQIPKAAVAVDDEHPMPVCGECRTDAGGKRGFSCSALTGRHQNYL